MVHFVDDVIGEHKKTDDKKKASDEPAKSKSDIVWRLPPRYQVKGLLGRGAYGIVCEAYDTEMKRAVAVKKVEHLHDTPQGRCIMREVAILSEVHHESIVAVHDLIAPDMRTFNQLYIVMELCDSDLKALCRAKCTLTPCHLDTILYNLLTGLKYLHSAGVYHRDLKPANVLLMQDCSVRIADFGLSRAIGGEEPPDDLRPRRFLTEHVVTRYYRAPELILLSKSYTKSVDVWSVGCIYAELLGLLGTPYKERRPLFLGESCYPLSPHERTEGARGKIPSGDQLHKIFDILGTPSAADADELERDSQRKYLEHFEPREGTGLEAKFRHAGAASVDVLERTLRFSPSRRTTVDDLLEHDIFLDIREPCRETVAPRLITLDFEQEDSLDETLARKHFSREIRKFHPEFPEL